MHEYGLRINDFLRGLFLGIGLKLVDFKIEFGRFYSEDGSSILLLADEISPDNCRLWDTNTNNKMDKDLFRQDIGGLKEAYQEVANRLGILPEKKTYSSTKTEIVKYINFLDDNKKTIKNNTAKASLSKLVFIGLTKK